MTITSPTIPVTANTIPAGIHSGDVTHHQLQSILSVSFNIRNTINNIVNIPVPSVFILIYLVVRTGFEPVLVVHLFKSISFEYIRTLLYH